MSLLVLLLAGTVSFWMQDVPPLLHLQGLSLACMLWSAVFLWILSRILQADCILRDDYLCAEQSRILPLHLKSSVTKSRLRKRAQALRPFTNSFFGFLLALTPLHLSSLAAAENLPLFAEELLSLFLCGVVFLSFALSARSSIPIITFVLAVACLSGGYLTAAFFSGAEIAVSNFLGDPARLCLPAVLFAAGFRIMRDGTLNIQRQRLIGGLLCFLSVLSVLSAGVAADFSPAASSILQILFSAGSGACWSVLQIRDPYNTPRPGTFPVVQ